MRITILQDHLRMGGTERQSLYLCDFFRRGGHDARLLLFRPGGSLWQQMIDKELPHQVLQPFDTGVSLLGPGLMETLERQQPDVVLCMGRTANCYSGFIQMRFPQTRVIGTLRTGKIIFPLHHWSMGRVRAVLVNSNWWKRRMLERGFPDHKVHVVHNPLMLRTSDSQMAQWREEMRAKMGAGPDTCVFVNVATFRPGKRHIELLDFFHRFASRTGMPWQLWLVGAGAELSRCRRHVAVQGLEDRVKFLGLQAATGPFYAGADVAVSASREDSLPNFLIEAQASGLPLVAVDCRGVVECCMPGETGIVVSQDAPEGFAQALERMASDPALRKAMAAKAPAFAQSRFCPDKQARLTLEFIETVCRNGRARGGSETWQVTGGG